MALEHGGADDRGQDVDEVHLEGRHPGEQRGPLGERGGRLLAHAGRHARERVEVQRQTDLADRLPQRLPHRMPHRLHVPRARELQPAQAQLGHAVDLLDRGVDLAVGQAGQADLAIRIVAAEVLQPVVVDPEHLLRRVVVVQTGGGAEDSENDLGLHAVQLHVLDPEVRIGRPPDALLAVLVQPDRGHFVDAVVLAGNQLLAARAHAPDQAEGRAVLTGPVGPVGAVDDVRHALTQ